MHVWSPFSVSLLLFFFFSCSNSRGRRKSVGVYMCPVSRRDATWRVTLQHPRLRTYNSPGHAMSFSPNKPWGLG
ncbi:hypothetical protein B0H16DRAFT_1502724 [Mycena metata]|uniref:Secreted protein n=1 Tax=Mycena metata TaxID=1033252 RepID=A0AAD7K6N3_9AGAR|nr:hypothetical protein B0H16DRAFT_1502724 [Mycena metata]